MKKYTLYYFMKGDDNIRIKDFCSWEYILYLLLLLILYFYTDIFLLDLNFYLIIKDFSFVLFLVFKYDLIRKHNFCSSFLWFKL